jgi:predicted RNA binding protein YcfA (HicA-like mRNA interferase family)
MPRLPRISGRRARAAFEPGGWTHARTTGDHMQLTMAGRRTLSVPDYDVLPAFVLRRLLRTSGMTVDEFLSLLNG